MVDSGHATIRQIGFVGQHHPDLPVEVVDYQALIDRMGHAHFRAAQRISFGLVFVVCGGEGHHTVDFEAVNLVPGRMVVVRPGQIQQWHVPNELHAVVVLARGSLWPGEGWFPGESASGDLGSVSLRTALDLTAALGREQERFVPQPVYVELMSALFASLIALFHTTAMGGSRAALPHAYVAFRAALEADLGGSRNVRDYVANLGYSERTVNRACRRVTGLSAKRVLDQRLLLEAKRLLAHTDDTVSAIGTTLGFSEATNFNKFFVRQGGKLPSEFRRQVRAAGYAAAGRG